MNEQLIKRAFLRGYRTGVEAASLDAASLDAESTEINIHMPDEKPTYKIGQVLEDGYLYAGFFQTDKESYHLAIAPKDEENEMNWNDAMKLDIPNRAEWSLININKGLFNLMGGYYWSSTENNIYSAVISDPQTDHSTGFAKTSTTLVRCVRRFGHSTI